jgi:hypothetical protein
MKRVGRANSVVTFVFSISLVGLAPVTVRAN